MAAAGMVVRRRRDGVEGWAVQILDQFTFAGQPYPAGSWIVGIGEGRIVWRQTESLFRHYYALPSEPA